MMTHRSGRRAQDEFKLLCSTHDVSCNESKEDDFGWDFFVEFFMTTDDGRPADMQLGPRSAFVQVKSTGLRPRSARMKVSNALHFSKRPDPCFLVLFHSHDGRRRIYARLFDETDIRRTLKQARQLSVAGRPPHKSKISFGFSDAEDHTEDLIEWMHSYVEGLSSEYSIWKQQLCDKIGYGEGGYRAYVKFAGRNGLEELIDLQLGLTDQLPVSHFRVHDLRFGIENPVPLVDHRNGGEFRLSPEREDECELTLETSDEVVSIPSKIRFPQVPGIPPEKQKVAVINNLFTLVVASEEITLRFQNLWFQKLPIEQLEQLARVLSWNDQKIRVCVAGSGLPPLALEVSYPSSRETPVLHKEVAEAIATLRVVMLRANVNNARLSLDDVLSRFRELQVFHLLLTAEQVDLKSESVDSSLDANALHNLLAYIDIELDECALAVLFDAAIKTSIDEKGHVQFSLGPRNLRDCLVGKQSQSVMTELDAVFRRQANAYGDDWVAIGDLGRLLGMRLGM